MMEENIRLNLEIKNYKNQIDRVRLECRREIQSKEFKLKQEVLNA